MPEIEHSTLFTERRQFSERRLVAERRRPPLELQDAVLATRDIDTFLQQLVSIAVSVIGGDVTAAVTVIRNGRTAMVAASDDRSELSDEVEIDGPSLTAAHTGALVAIEDLTRDERFSRFRRHALARGVRSAVFLPLDGGDDVVGALSLYSRHACAFGAAQLIVAGRFASDAGRALNLAVQRACDRETTDQLRTALVSRATIDQGIGIIMGQNRCDATTAFRILSTASQHRNVKLRLLTAEIVTAVSQGPPKPRSPA